LHLRTEEQKSRDISIRYRNLLANKEKYSEEELKEKQLKLSKFIPVQNLDMDGMIKILL
jgi:hypothetical protein